MAAGQVSGHQQGAFSTPQNGQSADASVVLSNDNATRTTTNAHDADATIHVQSSVLASRPAAGTAQRVWVTTDGLRAYVDSGTVWGELAYLPTAGGTVTGAVTVTADLTVSDGTDAVTTMTLGSGGASPTTQREVHLFLDAPSSGTFVGGTYVGYRRNGTVTWLTGTDSAVTGQKAATDDYFWFNGSAGGYVASLTHAGQLRLAAGLFVSAGGATVSAGTTAVQALTATTGVFSTSITTPLANTTSGATASLANGAGATILAPAASGVYLVVAKNAVSNAHYAHALVTYDTTSAATTITSLGAASITLGLSGTSVTLTNATGGTTTFSYAFLRLV